MTGSWRASGDEPRVGGVDARDVGEDLAAVGAEAARRARRRSCREPPRPRVVISPSSAARALWPWKPGHDDDLAGGELGADAARARCRRSGPGRSGRRCVMPACGPVRLIAGDAERVERHRHEGRALVLAGREQDVELARVGLVGDRRGEAEQLVGGVAHRGHDDDEVAAGGALAGDPAGDALDAVGVGDGRATELLDDERAQASAAHSSGASSGARRDGPSTALARAAFPPHVRLHGPHRPAARR